MPPCMGRLFILPQSADPRPAGRSGASTGYPRPPWRFGTAKSRRYPARRTDKRRPWRDRRAQRPPTGSSGRPPLWRS